LRYFKTEEFACKHCGVSVMNTEFLNLVDELRHRYGKPLVVNSGYRCPEHNKKVSTTGADGPHTTGKAADFSVRGADAYRLMKIAYELGFTGIGVSQKGATRFIHLDTIEDSPVRPGVWSY
jgi:zinc D-Ala-D-Ala carboxypeptidase